MKKTDGNNFVVLDAIVFIITLLVLGGCIFFVYKDLTTYDKAQNDITTITSIQQQNSQTIASFSKFKINSDDIANILPTQNTIVAWIEQTETMASLAGITESITFNNGAQLTKDSIVVQSQLSNAGTLPIDIVVKGSYSQILTFISLLEHDYFYTKIDEMSFSVTKVTSGTQSITAVSDTIAIELFVSNIQTQTAP